MKNFTRILNLFAMFALPLIVHAGADSSGGGNAVICFNRPEIVKSIRLSKSNGGGYIKDEDIPNITSVKMIDLLKIQQTRLINNVQIKQKIFTPNDGESEEEYEVRLLGRYKKLLPEIGQLLSYGKLHIEDFRAVPNGLLPIDDVGSLEVYNTNTCVRATIIAQYEENKETYVLYDERIYNLNTAIFKTEDRVASRWHEYLYLLDRKQGATNALATQSIVGHLFLDKNTYGSIVYAFKKFGYEIEERALTSFLNKYNNDVNKDHGNGFDYLKEIDTAAYELFLPVIGLNLIPAKIAFEATLENKKRECEKAQLEFQNQYEVNKKNALSILMKDLIELENVFPSALIQKIMNYYSSKVQNASFFENFKVEKHDVSLGTIYCKFDHHFVLPIVIPDEIYSDVLELNL